MNNSDTLNQRFVYIPPKAIFASILVHLSIPFLFLTAKILDNLGIPLFGPKEAVKLYQNYIQVDVVALPDIQLKDLPSVDTRLPVVEKPKTEANPVPIPTPVKDSMTLPDEKAKAEKVAKTKKEQEKRAEAEKLVKRKAEEEKALKRIEEDAKREAALKALSSGSKSGRAKMAGNTLAQGNAAVGAIGTARDRYQAMITQRIKENFNVFAWQKKKELVSVVHLEIFPNGRVRVKHLVKNSLDPKFDSAVLQAVDASQPLPVPEDDSLLAGGITIEFRP